MIDPELLEILVCPLGKAPLKLHDNKLTCTNCGLTYKIDNDIPVMLIEEAELPAGKAKLDQITCNGLKATK